MLLMKDLVEIGQENKSLLPGCALCDFEPHLFVKEV